VRRFGTIKLALAAASLLHLTFPLRGAELVDRILVRVNSRIVTQSMFNARLEQTLKEMPPGADASKQGDIKKAVVEDLVNEALLEDRARDLDLFTTEAEIDDQIKRLKEQNKVSSDEEFAQGLSASGLTVDKLRDQLRRSLTVQRVVGREVHSKIDLSDDALRIVYEREKESWRVPEQVRLAEILVNGGDSDASWALAARRAAEAQEKLKGDMKFDAAVGLYSDGATRSRGGDLGFISRGELNPELENAAFALPSGGVSDPIKSKYGFHILKVTEKKPVSYKPFSEVKADLLKREQDTQFQKKLADYLEKLKKEAVIRIVTDPTGGQLKLS
jgi:parvulin-like peptidyl-prolyl isomerase